MALIRQLWGELLSKRWVLFPFIHIYSSLVFTDLLVNFSYHLYTYFFIQSNSLLYLFRLILFGIHASYLGSPLLTVYTRFSHHYFASNYQFSSKGTIYLNCTYISIVFSSRLMGSNSYSRLREYHAVLVSIILVNFTVKVLVRTQTISDVFVS